jgi:hypothetical protein
MRAICLLFAESWGKLASKSVIACTKTTTMSRIVRSSARATVSLSGRFFTFCLGVVRSPSFDGARARLRSAMINCADQVQMWQGLFFSRFQILYLQCEIHDVST